MAFELDDTDLNIIELLEENGRRPNVEIARLIGISESTVRKRIERMQQANAFRSDLKDTSSSGSTSILAKLRRLPISSTSWRAFASLR